MNQLNESSFKDKFQLVDVQQAGTNLPQYVTSVPLIVVKDTHKILKGNDAFELLKTIGDDDGPVNYDLNYSGIMFAEIENPLNKQCENFSYINDTPSGNTTNPPAKTEMDLLMAQRMADVPSQQTRIG
jgi:hypothetical protein